MSTIKTYKNVVRALEKFEENPGYSGTQNEGGSKNKTLSAMKKCFQLMSFSGRICLTIDKNQDLKDLFIDGFDQEQVWQQIELKNRYLTSYVPDITNFLLDKNDIHFPSLEEKKTVASVEAEGNQQLEEINLEDKDSFEGDDSNVGDSDSEADAASSSTDQSKKASNIIRKERKFSQSKDRLGSAVDDSFFKISEMERFLDKAEKDELEDDGGIDYFEDIPSESDDGEKDARYDDFFRNPDSYYEEEIDKSGQSGNEDDIDQSKQSGNEGKKGKHSMKEKNVSKKRVKFLEGDSEESSNDTDSEGEKTTFEIRESKLRQKIEQLEESNLAEKPWQYKGEVDITDRPVNSLLEEVLDVDLTLRPPPVITETVTITLEQIIMNRIKDSAYDDVERKIKPVRVPHELKKELVLNQEKSKYSLAEVYEQEFLKRKPAEGNTEESDKPDPEKEKIKKAMKAVFHKLDVLSNFHYTPKPVSADIEIVSNMPAITMEEVTPVAMSDANLLAPQEIGDLAKKKLLGKDERTKTDKLRERRKKKAFLSRKFKKTQDTKSAKISKVLKSRNVKIIKPSGEDLSLKSSTSFFRKLQEDSEVHTNVNIKNKIKKIKQRNETHIMQEKVP